MNKGSFVEFCTMIILTLTLITIFAGGAIPTRELSITLSTSSLEIIQGKSGLVTANVTNTGEENEYSVDIFVFGLDTLSVTVTPSNIDLSAGELEEYAITVFVPSTVEAKTYRLTVKAESKNVPSSATLKLTVKAVIIEEAQNLIKSAENKINEVESKIKTYKESGWDISNAEIQLRESKNLLNQAKSYFDTGNYNETKSLANQAMNAVNKVLSLMKPPPVKVLPSPPRSYLWLVLGIAILAVGVVSFLLLIRRQGTYAKAKKFKF